MGARRRIMKTLSALNINVQSLEQWDLEIEGVEPRGKALLLETDTGIKCLKIFEKNTGEMNDIFLVLEHLAHRGFKNIPRFIRTRFGDPYIKSGENTYYCLSDWFPGCPIDLENNSDISRAAEELANLHRSSQGFILPRENEKITFINRQQQFQKIASIMMEFNIRTAQGENIKTYLRDMARRALRSCKLLNEAGYRAIWEKGCRSMGFCHGAFHEHHILVENGKKIFITGFDEWKRDLGLAELSGFILLAAGKKGWKYSLIQNIISSYDKNFSLYPAEWEVVRSFLLFPSEYWRLVKQLAERETEAGEVTRMLEACREKEEFKEKCLEDCISLVGGRS